MGGADVGLGRTTRAVLDLRLRANLRGVALLTAFAIDAGSSAGNQIRGLRGHVLPDHAGAQRCVSLRNVFWASRLQEIDQ